MMYGYLSTLPIKMHDKISERCVCTSVHQCGMLMFIFITTLPLLLRHLACQSPVPHGRHPFRDACLTC